MRIFASRQCADYARASYAGAGEARVARVTFAVGEASCLVFVESKPRWPRCAVVPDLHRQRMPSSAIYLSRAYLSVSDCVTHIRPIYLGATCLWYVTTFRVTFLSVTRHVRTYVLCENRSSISEPRANALGNYVSDTHDL